VLSKQSHSVTLPGMLSRLHFRFPCLLRA